MKQIHVRVVYDHLTGWAYWRRAVAIQKYAPDDMDITIVPHMQRFDGHQPIDVLYDMNYGHVQAARKELDMWHPKAGFAVAFNCGWQRRPEFFRKCLKYADVTVLNNHEYWDKAGRLANTRCIPNGVDTGLFRHLVPVADRPRKLLWLGSDYHRELKGYSLAVEAAKQLKDFGIESDIVCIDTDRRNTIKPQESMPAWYNSGRVFLCASENEGTPNPALEAAACGCAIVTTRVGNMPELIEDGVNGIFVRRDVGSIVAGVRDAEHNAEKMADEMLEVIHGWDWSVQVQPFYELFRELAKERVHV